MRRLLFIMGIRITDRDVKTRLELAAPPGQSETVDSPISPHCIIVLIQEFESGGASMARGGESVQIHISADDGVPIYLQIVNQVKYLVGVGSAGAG